MKGIVEAFGKSDLRPLFDALDENVVWKSASRAGGPFRFSGNFANRAGVVELISKLSSAYFFKRLEARDIVADGDIVWGLFDAELVRAADASGAHREIRLEMAIRWRLKNGKIVEHQGFFDTAALLA
jgi:ketosteroid isomerase-like protein